MSDSGSGYPNVCSGCGEKIVWAKEWRLWYEKGVDGVKRTWHFECRQRRT